MNKSIRLFWPALAAAASFVGASLLAVDAVRAEDDASALRQDAPPLSTMPHIPTALDETDADAALEGIRIALSEVADGSTYVWHRRDGRLSGMAQPTASYRDAAGQPCRHVVVMLNTLERTRKIEGIACRDVALRWHLSG